MVHKISILLAIGCLPFHALRAQDDVVPDTGGGFKLEELGNTAQEFILHIQQLGFIKAAVKLIEESNIDLLATYNTIREIQDGSFSLQDRFLNETLVVVKDEVKNHSKALQTLEVLNNIRQECRRSRDLIVGINVFTAAEKEFFTGSYKGCIREAGNIIMELTSVVTDSELKMNDGKRIEVIYVLYDHSLALYRSMKKFNDTMVLAAQLRMEQVDDDQHVRNLFMPAAYE